MLIFLTVNLNIDFNCLDSVKKCLQCALAGVSEQVFKGSIGFTSQVLKEADKSSYDWKSQPIRETGNGKLRVLLIKTAEPPDVNFI